MRTSAEMTPLSYQQPSDGVQTGPVLNIGPWGQASYFEGPDLRTQAFLYLFTPRIRAVEARRSHNYAFSEEQFYADVIDALRKQAEVGSFSRYNSYLYDSVAAHGAILPNAEAIPLNMRSFDHNWNFVLVVDNDYQKMHGMYVSPNFQPNRVIYSGICLDEPANPNMMGTLALNQNCYLQITHVTYMTYRKVPVGPGQGYNYTLQVDYDHDIVPPHLANVVDPYTQNKSLLDPTHMLGAVTTVGDEYTNDIRTITTPGAAKLNTYSETGVSMDALTKTPREHLRTIIEPIFNLQKTYELETIAPAGAPQAHAPNRGYGKHTGSVLNDLTTASKVSFNKSEVRNMTTTLNPTEVVNLEHLIRLYPGIKVLPFHVPETAPVLPTDPLALTPENIATSIISASVHPIMTNFGLGHVMFTYVSDIPKQTTFGNMVEDSVELPPGGIAPLVMEDTSITARRWEGFLNSMRQQVFSQIKFMHGPFTAHIASQGTGGCYVKVILHSYDLRSSPDEYTIVDPTLNSLATPLIGNEQQLIHNAETYQQLLPIAASAMASF